MLRLIKVFFRTFASLPASSAHPVFVLTLTTVPKDTSISFTLDKITINYNPEYIKMPKPWWKTRKFWILAGIAFFVGYFAFHLGIAYNTIVIDKSDKGPWWGKVANILPFIGEKTEPTPDPNPLPDQEKDRLDILLFGIRGEDDLENGGLLADSIQILSIDKNTKKTSIISLPRDLYI